MANIYMIPEWFFGYDIFLEFIFAIVTLVVGYYAFKIYKLSKQERLKLFGIAFLFFSISYAVQSILNFAIISELNENVSDFFNIETVASLNLAATYFYLLFFMTALVTLTYMTLHVKSAKTYSLLLVLSLLSIFLSVNKVYAFYLVSSFLLVFILMYYFLNFLENKQLNTFLIFVAFALLLFSSFHFILSVNHEIYYVLGHVFELAAYCLILVNLLLVLKNAKKKKSA
jgi:hypothetical protein